MNRMQRQRLILQVIETIPVSTQDELVQALAAQGVNVTQATISRDIRTLQLIKVKDYNGRFIYHAPDAEKQDEEKRLVRLLTLAYQSMSVQQNMIVMTTLPGYAPAIAKLLLVYFEEQLFTIMSNDDHFLMVIKEGYQPLQLKQEIEELIR